MRARSLGYLVSFSLVAGALVAGCGNSSNNPVDGGLDGLRLDGLTGDVLETGGPDALDGSPADRSDAAEVAPGATTQKLALTILVTDQIGGDGGLEVGPEVGPIDAAVGDAGTDADASLAALPTVDPNLVNPWGLAFNSTGPIWVADNHSGVSTVYSAAGAILPLVVTIPVGDGGTPPSAPTGLVFNAATTTFAGDRFVFSSEDGTITGWQTGTAASLRVDNSGTGAIYKGLALATQNGASRLYATDFHNAKVDVFDQTYAKVVATGAFADANVPVGYAPFGIQAIGAALVVTFAKQDSMKEDDDSGPGNGYVDSFDFDGFLTKRLVSQGALNSPWAIALAPSDFGAFSNALLIGNFGDGHINAYNATTGVLLGAALDRLGAPLAIDGLWSLVFGNDTAGAAHNRLFFTAGPGDESHGLLGVLDLP